MKIKAYAKVNLALDVIRRRSDGYHDLDMIMAPISLYDELHVEIAKQDSVTCSDKSLLVNSENTVVKAIKIMKDKYSLKECFSVYIEKKIPMQAGLGGGSADAAAMLHAINKLCHLKCTLDELIEVGVCIGADVPFCLINRVSRVKGVGEKIKPIQYHFNYKLLLVKPNSGVSTKEAFEKLNFTQCIHPQLDVIENKIIKEDKSFIFDLGNTLEYSACELNQDIKQVKEKLLHYSFDKVIMSGSGSTVFAISDKVDLLKQAKKELQKEKLFIEIVKIL